MLVNFGSVNPTSTLTATQFSIGSFNNSLLEIITQLQNSTLAFRAVKFTSKRLSEVLPSLDAFYDSLDKSPLSVSTVLLTYFAQRFLRVHTEKFYNHCRAICPEFLATFC